MELRRIICELGCHMFESLPEEEKAIIKKKVSDALFIQQYHITEKSDSIIDKHTLEK